MDRNAYKTKGVLMRTRIAICVVMCFVVAGNAFSYDWQDVTAGLTDEAFYSIAQAKAEGGVVYLGTSEGLYIREKDNGFWRQVFMCRGAYKGVNYICLNASGTPYIATGNGLYKSDNSGRSWKRIFRGLAEENYTTYVISGGKMDTIYIGTLKGFFWTEDGGKSWKKPAGVLGSSKISAIAIMEKEKHGKFFIICNNELYQSNEEFFRYRKIFGRESFKSFEDNQTGESQGAENEKVFLLNDITQRNNILYLSTNKGLFFSEDEGASWTRFTNVGLSDKRVNSALVSVIGLRVFVATRGGIFLYDPTEMLWRPIYSGMDTREARKLMEARDGAIWALCKRRIYVARFRDFASPAKGMQNPENILSRFKNEPTINEVMAMAIEYAEVYPEKIKKWRTGAKFKALLPKVNFGIDHAWSDTYEIYTSSSNSYWLPGPNDRTEGWDLNVSWDLSDLIWNESQTSIDVRSKLMVQLRDDIVDEVTRAYFERRRLQVEFLLNPAGETKKSLKKTLRIQELTATLDGLTGCRFSGYIKSRTTPVG